MPSTSPPTAVVPQLPRRIWLGPSQAPQFGAAVPKAVAMVLVLCHCHTSDLRPNQMTTTGSQLQLRHWKQSCTSCVQSTITRRSSWQECRSS